MFETDKETRGLKRYLQHSRVPEDGTYYLAVVGPGENDVMLAEPEPTELRAGDLFPSVRGHKGAVWVRVVRPKAMA